MANEFAAKGTSFLGTMFRWSPRSNKVPQRSAKVQSGADAQVRDRLIAPRPPLNVDRGRITSVNDAASKTALTRLMANYGEPSHAAWFDPSFSLFTHPDISGVVGFKVHAGCAIVLGAPLCAPELLPDLTDVFQAYCRSQGLQRVYVGTGSPFVDYALSKGYGAIAIGKEHWLDPRTCKIPTGAGSALRSMEKKGIRLQEYRRGNSPNTALETELQNLVDTAIARREGMQIYACEMQPFAAPGITRWFYAVEKPGTPDERVVGLLSLLRLGDGRYVIDHCVRHPDLQRSINVTDALHYKCLDQVKSEQASCVRFALAETPAVEGIHNFSPIMKRLISWGHAKVMGALHAEGKLNYRKKFSPQETLSYVVLDPPRMGLRRAVALMKTVHVDPDTAAGMVVQRGWRAALNWVGSIWAAVRAKVAALVNWRRPPQLPTSSVLAPSPSAD